MTPDKDRTQNTGLETLARARFTKLTAAEINLLQAAPKGEFAVCGPNMNDDDPANDPSKAEKWGEDRQIRADLIRWLCVDRQAKELVDPKGIQAYGAKIPDALDLSFVTVPFPLTLQHCRLMDETKLIGTEIPELNLEGSRVRSIGASRIHVKGSVFLHNGFRAEGEVRVLGAQMGGDLDCRNATFKNPPQAHVAGTGLALAADHAVVKGGVYLRNGFHAEGEVRFLGAQIGGDLDCDGATFKNPLQLGVPGTGLALAADRAVVHGSVFLGGGFRAEGKVRLPRAQVEGDLDCSNATFENPPQPGVDGTGPALSLDRAVVEGNIFLRDGFRSEGEVRLLGAEIAGTLDCSNATFENPLQPGVARSGLALAADRAVVTGSVFLCDGFRAKGEVRLLGAQTGGNLECTGPTFSGKLNAGRAAIKGAFLWTSLADPAGTKLDLTNASVGALDDDAKSWPSTGNLFLDGFVYQRISGGPRDAESRLKWLARQDPFAPQPYRQLAKVLRDEGNDDGARLVLFEMERRRRKQEDRGWFARVWSRILRSTIGYGYDPEKALWWLAGLSVLGLILFWGGYAAGSIAPTDNVAYSSFKQNSHLPPHYETFHASIYSLENALPLVKLGQVDRWQPDPDRHWECKPAKWVPSPLCVALSPTPLRWFRWAQICLGWILATLFVAGVTGIVRKD
jgi:sRNA-binding regulator protein Hfq